MPEEEGEARKFLRRLSDVSGGPVTAAIVPAVFITARYCIDTLPAVLWYFQGAEAYPSYYSLGPVKALERAAEDRPCSVPGICSDGVSPAITFDALDPFSDSPWSVNQVHAYVGELALYDIRHGASQLPYLQHLWPLAYFPETATTPGGALSCEAYASGTMFCSRINWDSVSNITEGSIKILRPHPRRLLDSDVTGPLQTSLLLDSATLEWANTALIPSPDTGTNDGCFSADTLFVVKDEAAPIPLKQLRTGQHIQCVDSGADLTTPGAVRWCEVPNFSHVNNSKSILQQRIRFRGADGTIGNLTVTQNHLILRLKAGAAPVGSRASTVAACECRG